MPNTELLIHLAEMAGVFVGFGALISIRSDTSTDEYEVTTIRMIVWTGIVVVITALFPVVLGDYGIDGHGLWVASSVLFLVLFWVGGMVMERLSPERSRYLAALPRRSRIRFEIPALFLWVPMNIALVLVLLGPFPDQEPILYATAVALNLVMDALLLLYLVFRQPRPQPAQPPAEKKQEERVAS
jgi:hypothetical protein